MPNTTDKYARHAHYLEQYYNGQASKIDKYLNRVAKALREKLTQTDTVTSQARIVKLLTFTEELMAAELSAFTDDIYQQLELFAESEAEFASSTLKLTNDFESVIPAPSQIMGAVNSRPFNNRLLKDYLDSFTKEQAKLVRQAVSTGFYEGQTTQEITRGIIGTKSQDYKNGILNISRTSGERMVRTALNHTSNTAKNKFFEANIDLIPYYEWLSTLDSRTSPICQSRDGKTWKTGKGPLPPAHYNCRSTTVPLTANEVNKDGSKKPETGKRSSVDGPVSANLNYNDWLKKQSKSFQIDALGETKADLFRKGGLSVDKFVNNKGQALTLDQLKSKYPTAWGKI